MVNTYGSIFLDGDLKDWTFADRLDYLPGTGLLGYEIYGKLTGDAYVFAIKANVAIASGTTFWLNTDRDTSTGYQIFGSIGGAEYNVNFFTDNNPYLYTGAAGQNFVGNSLNLNGGLDYAYSANQQIIEFAVPLSLLNGASGAIDLLVDINNQIFLPGDYTTQKYTLSPTGNNVSPITLQTTFGNISLDGNLNDWTTLNRLDFLPGTGQTGYEIYGKYAGDNYIFAIKANSAIANGTTFWLNTDRDANTGYQIFGLTGGAEYNINFFTDNKPYLYTGAAGENFVGGALNHAFSSNNQILEIAVPVSLLQGNPTAIDLLLDVNNQVFLPGDYDIQKYTIDSTANLPPRTDLSKKVGIVFSQSTAQNYFDEKAYTQLFLSMQYQAMQAGIPFDILTEDDLTDINKIVNYDSLIFPSFRNVASSKLAAIEKNLTDAVYKYNIGLITAGDFMTNDQNGGAIGGDPYSRMKNLFGLTRTGGSGPVNTVLRANDTTHPVMLNYSPDEQIRAYNNIFVNNYDIVNTQGFVLADREANGQNFNAVIATKTGGRNVHFATEGFMADNNLVWEALQWSVVDRQSTVRLNMSRDASIFISRDDVDQSKFAEEVPVIENAVTNILKEWKNKYNFVGSHYINIGNTPSIGEYTDWSVSAPIYKQWLALGNEIGTHSYTHPDFTSNLTPAELEFQFNQSKQIIGQQLGINVTGAAIPGNPESLYVSRELKNYLSYVSGGYSGVGAGYPGAFGFMFPGENYVYLAPNVSFDFNLIDFKKLTAQQADLAWAQEYADVKNHASQAIIHWPWHDYGITESEPGYQKFIFDNFLARAYNDNTEFVTVNELSERIKTFEKSQVFLNTSDNTINAKVVGSDLGAFSLNIDNTNQKIKSVNNWYAYDDDTVFLPQTGGEYTINLGATPDNVTRIVDLPMRAELTSVTGNGQNLEYTFTGEGKVVVSLNIPSGKRILTNGANSNKLTGNLLEMNFTNNTQHTAKISLVDLPTVRAEAESMNRTTYRVESLASASGTRVISLAGGVILPIETGTASYNFTGVSGRYNVVAGYYDENDGIAQLQVRKGNSILDSWNLNQNRGSASPNTQTFTTRTVASNLSINQGDNFSIFGRENLGEFARVDYLDFVPVSNSVRIEAESATRTNYRVESIASASGGQAISFSGGAASEVGNASFNFTGVSGRYNLVVGYYDENDGIARLEVKKGNAVLDTWNLDQNRGSNLANAQTFTTRTIASGLSLDRGDTFTITGNENRDEYARVDYIDFISVDTLI
jgi:peptidoglycan/xylan/chitin deacetylase (PgdA/CDA1 family)